MPSLRGSLAVALALSMAACGGVEPASPSAEADEAVATALGAMSIINPIAAPCLDAG